MDRQSPAHPPTAPSLVGRDREQASLRVTLAATLVGRGSLVLLGGEAGIGKTALAESLLAEAAEQGVLLLIGRCYDLSETPPYGPWVEALAGAPVGGALPALPSAVLLPGRGGIEIAGQDAITQRVVDYLTALAARQPLILLLDDLHWADPASLDLLRVVARGLANVPTLLLATYRADELTRRHPLYALLPALVREARALRIDLRPLDSADLLALVQARYTLPADAALHLTDYLAVRAEGNPLFTGEILRAIQEVGTLARNAGSWTLGELAAVGVPPLLRQVIDTRADRLGEDKRGLLALAAVIGQDVPLDLWAVLSDSPEDALLATVERALEARLLDVRDDGVVRFAHALIREVLYEGMLPTRRRALHRRVGEALAATTSPDPDAVAYHFRTAGDARAVAWLVAAGERAQRAYAWLTAAERFQAALALLEAQGGATSERAWLLYRLAQLLRLGDTALGLRYLDEALTAATACGDRALAACIRCSRGGLRCQMEDIRGGVAEMAAGVAALDALSPADRDALASVNATWLAETVPVGSRDAPAGDGAAVVWRGIYALWLSGIGYHDEALALGERVAARTATAEPGDLLAFIEGAYAHWGLGFVHAACGRVGEARAAFGRSRERYRALDHHQAVSTATNRELDWAILPYQADQLAERRALVAETERALTQAASVTGLRADQDPYWSIPILEGRWGEIRASAPAPLEGSAHFRHWLGLLARAQGDAALAWQLVLKSLPDGPATEPGGTYLLTALALQRLGAALALDTGDVPTARKWLEAHDRWLAWSGATLGRADGALGWAEYYRATSDRTAARTFAEQGLVNASDPRQPLVLLAAHRLLGELETADGHPTDAATHLEAALALAEACAAPYERALALLARAELCAATGDRDAAQSTLAQARSLLEPLGAQPALARAEALAARLSAPPSPATTALPFGLTAREVDVLRLIAEGLTDPQIAERLYVSRNTVNTHLRAIYGKLGVNTRTAAARLATEHGLA